INDNTTLQNSGVTVTNGLTVAANKTFTLATVTLTDSAAAEVTWGNASSTIAGTGTGTLTFPNGAGGPGTSGVISSVTRFDATSGAVAATTFDARTYSGKVELYSTSASSRTVTASGSYILSGTSSHLHLNAGGSGDLKIDGDTNNPTMTIGGDLDFVGTGDGFEIIAAGTGTWTVSGNVDFTNGVYGPSVAVIGPSYADTARRNQTIGWETGCSMITSYYCIGSGTVQYGTTHTGDCLNNVEDETIYTDRGWMQYDLSSLNGSATITGATVGVTVSPTGTYSSAVSVARSTTDALNGQNCTNQTGTWSKLGNATYGTVDLSAAGNKIVPLGATGVVDVDTRAGGATPLAIGLHSASAEASMGSISAAVSSLPPMYVAYTTATSSTLVMNGTSKTLTPGGNGFYNLNVSGTVTFANEAILVSGDLNLTGGDVTPGTSTMTMAGAGKTLTAPVAGDTLYALNIDPTTAGTVTLAAGGGDLNTSSSLTVATGDTLSLGASRTLTVTPATGTTLVLNGTISGSGRLTYMSSVAFPSTGTISSTLRFDATTATSQSITSRTYGGPVEIYNNSGGAKTVSSGIGTMLFSSTLDLSVGSGSVTLDLNTTDPNTTTVTGGLTIGAGTTLSAPSTNSFSVNGNYTNSGTFTDNSGTVTLAGSGQQALGGTMTGSSDFNNIVVTNAFGDGNTTWSVTFGTDAAAAGTFTANTANTKLRFNATSTYTFVNVALNGQATNSRVLLRSSSGGAVWNLVSTGTQTVSNTDVRDSDACGGDSVDASNGTNFDSGNTRCWLINTISLAFSDLSVGFGSCVSGSARYATSNAAGAGSDTADAHTITVSTNARNGYTLSVAGATLTGSNGTITAIGGTALASSPGSEQFGLRSIKNSGSGAVSSPFETANWAFTPGTTPQTVATYTGSNSSYSAEYGLRYICNINALTEAGGYATDLTYVVTSTF
ncbi:MAG: hypothetical protein HY975_01475, partial [Candidatus Kerfeldbacteria bacterium]|nr:hypothetical protein [Candidatus Kerfeldbacteria bacterium]